MSNLSTGTASTSLLLAAAGWFACAAAVGFAFAAACWWAAWRPQPMIANIDNSIPQVHRFMTTSFAKECICGAAAAGEVGKTQTSPADRRASRDDE